MFTGLPRRSLLRGAWFFGIGLMVFLVVGIHAVFNPPDRYMDAEGNAVGLSTAMKSFEARGQVVPIMTKAPKSMISWQDLITVTVLMGMIGSVEYRLIRELRRQANP